MQKIEILFIQKSKVTKSNQNEPERTRMSFCKVCYDAGKPKADYTTHYVRDRPGGKVICPTILNQQCKYCKKLGHTPSHCPELEGKYQQGKYQKGKYQQAQDQPPKKEERATESPPTPRSMRQKRAAKLCESPPPQRSALQQRAARLCESPPPLEKKSKNYFKSLSQSEAVTQSEQSEEALSENFPAIGHTDSGKIIRPAPLKMNVWASIVQAPKEVAPKAEEQIEDEVKIEVKVNPYTYSSWADCE